ncbi:MAG: hypothetical protein ACREIA_24055, partial [Opitutaceae bacterium]
IGSVWSPPGWMKENGSRTGTRAGCLLDPKRDYDDDNRLRPDRYRHFAKWIVEWARYMESQGTPFFAISLQNELMFTQWFESTLYSPDEYARVVQVTGEMFESEGVRKPLFFGPEDMTQAAYADAVRHRPTSMRSCDRRSRFISMCWRRTAIATASTPTRTTMPSSTGSRSSIWADPTGLPRADRAGIRGRSPSRRVSRHACIKRSWAPA